ncbi:uncharacterized protein B0H18DRAFT_996855 [Fomitopsis serialis]|uniref:uncharacterized protein n=1 Tax=Fomitopsis serialis TaxID=139415 RepID=UPI002007F7AA|nr:uncharacterized protein B0H18DRAFT_996855 [Neoantrodia serialis]KAH9929380.1 hypothetical protein B0H18DRAFT_996855 [Neoantrodia serialis]
MVPLSGDCEAKLMKRIQIAALRYLALLDGLDHRRGRTRCSVMHGMSSSSGPYLFRLDVRRAL